MTAMRRTFRDRVLPWWYWRRSANRADRVGVSITGTPVLTATEDAAYDGFTVEASGGTEPYVYSVGAGELPAGITLDDETGEIAGTPTEAGTFIGIVIRARDANQRRADLPAFTLTVEAA